MSERIMRRTCASLLLLLLAGASFAPLAHAKLTGAAPPRPEVTLPSAGGSQHGSGALPGEPPSARLAPARPLPAHPIIEEFYPPEKPADALARETEAAASSDR